MAPKQDPSLDEKDDELPREAHGESRRSQGCSSSKKSPRKSILHPEKPHPAVRGNLTPSQRKGRRLCDHVGSKVDSKLDLKYIPGESQYRTARAFLYRRSDGSLDPDDSQTGNIDLYEENAFQEVPTAEGEYTSGNTPMLSSQAFASYSEHLADYFGGKHTRSGASTPTYHSGSETSSLNGSGQNSRSSSRKQSLEHPTSNPSEYAKSTKSAKQKMKEKLGYNPTAQGLEDLKAPLGQRKVSLGQGSATTPVTTPGELKRTKAVTFEEPLNSAPAPDCRKRHKRAMSLRSQLELEDNYSEYSRIALEVTNQDLLYLKNDFNRGRLSYKEVLGRRDAFPTPVNSMRERMVLLIGSYERQIEDERLDCFKSHTQQESRIAELEEALQTSLKQKEQDQAILQQQADRIKQLEENPRAREVSNTSEAEHARNLQQALHLNQFQAKKIQQLEEVLQTKHIDDAVTTGKDTPNWHAVYTRRGTILAAQEAEMTHLKASIRDLVSRLPALERENADLRAYVAAHRDTVAALQGELHAARTEAEEWHTEFEQQRDMFSAHVSAEATELADLREEMQGTITAYHALLPSPDHPDTLTITGLTRKLAAQGKATDELLHRLDTMKHEKGALERELEALLEEKLALELELRADRGEARCRGRGVPQRAESEEGRGGGEGENCAEGARGEDGAMASAAEGGRLSPGGEEE
ncbi:hypothetical protein BU23DRAFT_602062 [Bimuria novae-zelandiae CBS 107.79]|uniref:Uncharacterized protein n=1 Tax=Bimuria novae-zelandiae CBS 107.79 TaxID=1447943 RepID=A0A6A5UXR5_9PLEO|nr:hypothetical protein BU23DRAFT_602062 [Bimuria novae-zelandiae CBS 107.79]